MEADNLAISISMPGDDAEAELHDKVIARRCYQREALPGEPRCLICGRYGEYICDETDDDVCSLQCKGILLERVKSKLSTSLNNPSPKRLPAADECFYVRDGASDGSSNCRPLTEEKAELLRKRLDIQVKGGDIPLPILSFSCCNLPDKLLKNIESAGFELPTSVQMQAIPAAAAGKSLLVSADTGSGKTASYLIPVISRCISKRSSTESNLNEEKKPLAIVLTPTRELCVQVEEVAKLFGRGLPFKTAHVIGGDAMACQLYRIQQGVELIIATPGRLVDLLTKHDVDLGDVSIFVIDEVDCMLQSGFRDQVLQIFSALSQPQVLMYSATVSRDIEKMATSTVDKNLITISIGQANKPSDAIKQLPIWVESKQKKQKLFDILTSKQHFKPPVIVFVGSRLGADLLSEAVTAVTGIKALSVHGEKPMSQRREIIRSFFVGEVSVLVATGLLGRGIDLLSVRQVIVFDFPCSITEYVHLIGRASKLGQEGNAIVFINEDDKKVFPELVTMLKSSGAPIPKELANSRYTVCSVSASMPPRKRRKYGR